LGALEFAGYRTGDVMSAQWRSEVVVENTFLSVVTLEDKQRKLQAAPRSKSAGARMQGSSGSAPVGAITKAETDGPLQCPNSSMSFQQALGCERNQTFNHNRVLDEITTTMVRNIPYQYNLKELLAEFEELGLGASYDFVFLPLGNNKRQNLGYAFVNLPSAEKYRHFVQALTNYRFKKNTKKRCKPASLKKAAVQGLLANLTFARQTSNPSAFFVPESKIFDFGTSIS